MRKCLIIILLAFCLSVGAQTHKELRDSLSHAIEELAYRPDSIDLRLKKAAWNLELEQWDYALSEYNYVLKLQPRNIAALFYRAFAYEKLHRYKFARADYETLLQIVPNFEVRLGLALLNQKDKHHTEALDQLNSLCQYFPERAEAFAARAGVEEEQGMLELAEFDYGEALRIDPKNIDYLLSRLDIRIKLKRKAGAIDDLQQLAQLGYSPTELAAKYKKIKKL